MTPHGGKQAIGRMGHVAILTATALGPQFMMGVGAGVVPKRRMAFEARTIASADGGELVGRLLIVMGGMAGEAAHFALLEACGFRKPVVLPTGDPNRAISPISTHQRIGLIRELGSKVRVLRVVFMQKQGFRIRQTFSWPIGDAIFLPTREIDHTREAVALAADFSRSLGVEPSGIHDGGIAFLAEKSATVSPHW